MKQMVSVLILALVAISVVTAGHEQKQERQTMDRQGRSSNGNNLNQGGNSNVIEHNSIKTRLELDKRQIQEFLTTKSIFKSIVKLMFGNQDDISATSRHVLGILSKALDILKNTFGQKSRSGTARTIRDSVEDAANAGISMLQGYVKSVQANDDRCAQKYLCQASKEATRESRDLGYIIASVGGYATSYLLDTTKSSNFKTLYDASVKGRSMKEDCGKLYPECPE